MTHLLNKIFVTPTQNIFLQLIRYGFVGGVAFVADYGALFCFTEYLGFDYLASAAIAFTIGLAINYVLSTIWVFTIHSQSNRLIEFLMFTIIGIVGLGLNEMIMYIGTDMAGLHYMLSKLISTAIVFLWNFFARRMILFNKKVPTTTSIVK